MITYQPGTENDLMLVADEGVLRWIAVAVVDGREFMIDMLLAPRLLAAGREDAIELAVIDLDLDLDLDMYVEGNMPAVQDHVTAWVHDGTDPEIVRMLLESMVAALAGRGGE